MVGDLLCSFAHEWFVCTKRANLEPSLPMRNSHEIGGDEAADNVESSVKECHLVTRVMK